jgi:signal transduction histidine kinase
VDRDREQVKLATDDRVFRAVQNRMFRLQSTGAAVIVIMVIMSSAGDWPRFGLMVAIHAVLFPFNLAYDRLVVQRIGSKAETYRHLVNQSVTAVGYAWLGWPIAGFMWVPFTALAIDESAGRRGLYIVIMCSVLTTGGSLLGGVVWYMPVIVSVFSVICWEFTRARGEIIRQMLVEAQEQRDELARTEVELRQAQKLEAIGRLAAGVAHEINTPMQFVSDNLKFVTESAGDLLALAIECASPEKAQAADLEYLGENVPAALAQARASLRSCAR